VAQSATPFASRLKPYTYSAEGLKESCAAPSDALKAQYMLALGRMPQKQDVLSSFEVESS